MNDKVGVALVKYVCPICGEAKEDLSAIVLNKRLTKTDAHKVESMHNQVVGYSDVPCKECQSYIDKESMYDNQIERQSEMVSKYYKMKRTGDVK